MILTQDVEARVTQVLVKELHRDSEEIHGSSSLADDLSINSLDAVELADALQTEFEIEVPNEDFAAFVTVQDVIDYVIKKLK